MNEKFLRLWNEVAEGTATPEQIAGFNQRLRENPELCDSVAQYLLDDALIVEELRTRGMVDSLGKSSVFPNTTTAPANPSHRAIPWIAVSVVAIAASCLLLVSLWHWVGGPNDQVASKTQVASETMGAVPANPLLVDLKPPMVDPPQWPSIVGTVVQSQSCRWQPPLRDQQHVVARRYRLSDGTARMILVNGIELIADASDGPVVFEVAENLRRAELHTGSLIAKVHAEEIGFVIQTPTTNIVDVGTQFAVNVDDQGRSLVDVLEGAVAFSPTRGETMPNQSMFASDWATRFDADDDSSGQPVRSQRESLGRIQDSLRSDARQSADLIAFEPFGTSEETPGFGWASPWCFARSGENPAPLIILSRQFADVPAWLRRETQQYLVQPIFSVKNRKLSNPVDLSVDRDYYVSVLMRRRTLDDSNRLTRGCGLSLHCSATGLKKDGLGFTLDADDRFTVWTGDERFNGGVHVDAEQGHFVVMKVAAKKSEPDQVYVRVYRHGDAADVLPPKTWHAIGKPVSSDLIVDAVSLWTDQSAVAFFDELRLGATWRSVVPIR
jgi:ferric-dicitrate binding protein FerR (iron transport regulator)